MDESIKEYTNDELQEVYIKNLELEFELYGCDKIGQAVRDFEEVINE